MTPESWSRQRLGDLVDVATRGKAPKYEQVPTGVFAVNQKCVRGGKVQIEPCRPHAPEVSVDERIRLRSGDVCVNSTGTGTIGRVGLWMSPEQGIYFPDSHVTLLRVSPGKVEPTFLAYTLDSTYVQQRIERECYSGSTNQVELNRSAFLGLDLSVPPIPEQRKIAAILSSIDETIERTEEIALQLDLLFRATRDALLVGGLVSGTVPPGWGSVALEDLAQVITKGTTPTTYGHDYVALGVPFLRVENITENGELQIDKVKFISNETHQFLARSRLRAGDVLLSIAGALGRVAVVPETVVEANLNQAIALVRLKPDAVDVSYLTHALMGPQVQAQIGLAKSQLAQANLNLAQVGSLLVPFPPRFEQRRIAEILNAIRDRCGVEAHLLLQLRALKAALSSSLLSGELRATLNEAAA
jgi:type I restriction enzyme, S subunit